MTGPARSPSLRDVAVSRRLGDELRTLRERAGLSAARAARLVGVTAGTVRQWEHGVHAPSVARVRVLLDAYQAAGPARDAVLALAETTHHRPTAGQPRMPARLRTLLAHERRATRIHAYCPVQVPAWLQARAYTRAVLAGSPTIPTGKIEPWLEVWQSRTQILSRLRPPQVSVVLAEQALDPASARPMMAQQRRHLADRATWPHVQVRVLPAVVGQPAHAADQFTIIDLDSSDRVVHAHSEWADRLVTEPDAVAEYTARFARLINAVLDGAASVAFIASRGWHGAE